MDPNATLDKLIDKLNERSLGKTRNSTEPLIEAIMEIDIWLTNGGAMPDLSRFNRLNKDGFIRLMTALEFHY